MKKLSILLIFALIIVIHLIPQKANASSEGYNNLAELNEDIKVFYKEKYDCPHPTTLDIMNIKEVATCMKNIAESCARIETKWKMTNVSIQENLSDSYFDIKSKFWEDVKCYNDYFKKISNQIKQF
jgi:uncharacterized membrane protein